RVRDLVLGERARCDVVVVSDYAKGVIGPHLLAALAAAHARAPFTWVVDPKRANFAHYRRASLMKPNRAEAAEAAGIEIRDRPSLCAVGARLLERWETEAVLISRGDEGMALFKRGGAVQEFPTAARGGSRAGGDQGPSEARSTRCARAVDGPPDEQAADGPLGRVRSMTGYGAGRADAPSARVTVEVRGVNQRFLDLRIVAPREYAA